MMWSVLIAVCIASVGAADEAEEAGCETCLRVDGACYNLTYITELEAPFRNQIVIPKMAVLHNKNTLYYTFEPTISDSEYFKVGFVHLDNTNNSGVILADKKNFNFGTFDIDQDNNDIYLGGSNGIYILSANDDRLTPYSSLGDTIISLFFKGFVYFVRSGENKIIQKRADNFIEYLEDDTVKNFVINKNYIIVYLSTRGLYASTKGSPYSAMETVLLSRNSFFRGLTVDAEGTVYAWWVDGIYKVTIGEKLSSSRIDKVARIPTIGAMTFDKQNNILFTSDRKLYRLSKTTFKDC